MYYLPIEETQETTSNRKGITIVEFSIADPHII